jgi:hypothetical protein
MIYLFGAIATFIMVFGMEGRGSWSRNISVVGGLLWVISIALAFYYFSWRGGALFIVGTFVLGAILQKILRPFLNPHGQ